jgi:Ca-activated chloride channel homolog
MKKITLLFLLLACSLSLSYADGVMIVNASSGECFPLLRTKVSITVNNQVAIFTTTSYFQNTFNADTNVKYAFPMPDDANAINLRWFQDNTWHQAVFSSNEQDTVLPGPGGTTDPDLLSYVGQTPLMFELINKVKKDSIVIVELTYVQLLPYAFSYVSLNYPGNYSLIQQAPLDTFECSIHLKSARTIEEFSVLNPTGAFISIADTIADVMILKLNYLSSSDLVAKYKLAPDELGLFSFSTYLPDSAIVCDTFGRGYFAFIVEPNPNDSVVIQKDFILIIDQSGSMSGTKITQAKDAAKFVVNHLNDGDRFNIVKFQSTSEAFQANLIPFDQSSQLLALNYIDNISANGSTCVSCAFNTAIPQYSTSSPDAAKIIIFFTDGEANTGTSDNPGILNLVNSLCTSYAPDLNLHTFGIGTSVNTQLLSQLAQQHNGQAVFLSDTSLYQTITNFYLTIQNPVMLNTSMSFNPPVIYETYPDPLLNLYGGSQLLVVGRYNVPGTVEVTFEGTAFGDPVTYIYDFPLADTIVSDYHFLPKIWAKKKIDHMVADYYALPAGSTDAVLLEKEIKLFSICNGVMSVFTSFVDNGGPTEINEPEMADPDPKVWPNPFSDMAYIDISGFFEMNEDLILEIYSIEGVLIYRSLSGQFTSNELLSWNGSDFSGASVNNGCYFYRVISDHKTVTGKIFKFK